MKPPSKILSNQNNESKERWANPNCSLRTCKPVEIPQLRGGDNYADKKEEQK